MNAELHRHNGNSATYRPLMLFTLAAITGAAGWSGLSWFHYFALLYPFIYLHSSRRLDSLSAIFYYAAATWSVLPASASFFSTGTDFVQPVLIWFSLIGIGAAPWIVFYNRYYLLVSAVVSLTVLAIPPLGLVSLAHPLIASGQWFPGTRWLGLMLPLLLVATYRLLGCPTTLAVMLAASLIVHTRFHQPVNDPAIVALNTHLGGNSGGQDGLDSPSREAALQQMALAHPNSLVILPESIIPAWSRTHEARWAATFTQLRQQHTGLLIGTTIPIPNSQANRNVLLSRGYTEHLSYVQRVPIPLGMWHIGDGHVGFPPMLRYPSTIWVWNHRVGVLICYEQLLVWPAIQTLSRNTDMLIAPSNLYWAYGTRVPAIQHLAAQDWANLWTIPLYEASNQ